MKNIENYEMNLCMNVKQRPNGALLNGKLLKVVLIT